MLYGNYNQKPTMIPHGTIERLDHLIRLIESKKDYQDERIMQGITYRPDYEIDVQLFFHPPTLTNGEVTENSLYQWIEQLCLGYEEELRHSPPLRAEYRETYGNWHDDAWLAPQPNLSELEAFPDDEEDFGAKLRVVADYSPGPAAIPEEEEEPAHHEQANYRAPRFSWPEK
jgi:hypothetical protein